MSDAGAGAVALSFVVDSARRIRESHAPELRDGDVLRPRRRGSAKRHLDAIDAGRALRVRAAARGSGPRARHRTWIVHACLIPSTDPWLARVVAVDATPAVSADREAIFAKLIHSTTNISFALGSALDVLAIDRPTGAPLDRCLAYLREPVRRLSETMTRLAACLVPPRLLLRPASVEELVESALSRTLRAGRPGSVTIVPPAMRVSCDIDALSETVAAMLEGGPEDPAGRLEVDRVEVGGRLLARVVVERGAPAGQDPHAVAGSWDLHGGQQLDPQLRLSLARAVVFAHGGDVFAESAAIGRVRLGMRLPLLTVDWEEPARRLPQDTGR